MKELGPQDNDWLYTRAASLAYQMYMRGTVGMTGLRRHYGGKHRRGTLTEKTRPAAAKNIRYCLKALQDAGLVGLQKYVYDKEE